MALETHLALIQKAKDKHAVASAELAGELAHALSGCIPDGRELNWAQYTPYFNDGDACEFSVDTPLVAKVGSYDQGSLLTPYWIDRLGERALAGEGVTVEEVAQLRQLAVLWGALREDTLLAAFGDHAEVTIQADGSYSVATHDHG